MFFLLNYQGKGILFILCNYKYYLYTADLFVYKIYYYYSVVSYINDTYIECMYYYYKNNMKSNVMALHQYPVFSGKQDILREVVIKYIDHFYPK